MPDQVSVVFQDARLLPWQRVLPNVVLGLPPGAARRGRESLAAVGLAAVGLAGRERAWPNELSGGEQQRVAPARFLVREPRPSVLLVTHDVDEAIALADRVLVLDDHDSADDDAADRDESR
ncbi:ATP-binding cassette domain-containing protein [Nonomuraea fuscirosea]|uniref:ATP-binding cassette domain-containing protein n=1 Tax=Nonomuraea fuscirosea TaxID=1291556 RepID=UPI00371EA4CC